MYALTRAITKRMQNFCCNAEGSRSPGENIEIERIIPMEIWMDFDNINTPSHKVIKFHADIQGCHRDDAVYFNGQLLINSHRVTISCNSFEHSIKIQDVDLNDIGVYVCQCRHNNNVAITYGTLNVAPDLAYRHEGSYTLSTRLQRNTLRVSTQLVSVRTYAGKEFSLVAQFRSPWLDGTIYWFRNNKLLCQNEHVKLLKSTLQIKSAVLEDSGVYHCVYKTQRGTVSSVCDVIVINNLNLEIIINPTIGCHSKSSILVNLGDDIRFIIKSKVSMTASGHWYFGNKRLKESRRVFYDDYGEGFIGLRILGATGFDQGRYFLVQADLWSDYTYRVEFFVTVIRPLCNYSIRCNRVRHMLPMVACLGARCIFDAEFTTDSTEFFVQWIVGRNLVRSDDTRFKMISLRDTHALLIKCVDQSMNGEVVCELRAINYREMIAPLIKKTATYLTIVPPDYVKALRSSNCLVNTNSRMVQLEPADLYPSKITSGRIQRIFYDAYISEANPEVVFKFYLMRLEGSYFYHKVLYHMDILDKEISVSLIKLQLTKSRKVYCFELYWGVKTEAPFYYTAELAIEREQFWRRDCTPSTELSTRPYVRVEDVGIHELILCYVRRTFKYPNDDRKLVKSLTVRFPKNRSVITPRLIKSNTLRTQYRSLGERIGLGSFASAHLLERLSDGEIIVAKCAFKNAKCNEHLIKEYRLLQILHHPNIIQVYGLITDDKPNVLLMEYMRGGSLTRRLRANKMFSENETKMYIRDICRGLAYLHSKNIVHLDIKPDNVVCINPGTNRVKIIDFGLAQFVPKNCRGICAGTRHYIAPELLHRNELSTKCDMYSVGVTTYVLLTGKLPFKTKTYFVDSEEEIDNLCGDIPFDTNNLKYISEAGVMFIKGCLEKNPKQRLSSKKALDHPWLRKKEQNSSSNNWFRQQMWGTDGSLVRYQEPPMVLDLKFNNEKITPRRLSSPIKKPMSSMRLNCMFSKQANSAIPQFIEDEQEELRQEQDFCSLTLKTYEPQDHRLQLSKIYEPQGHSCNGQPKKYDPQGHSHHRQLQMYESRNCNCHAQETYEPQVYCCHRQETREPKDYYHHDKETYEAQSYCPYPQDTYESQDSLYSHVTYEPVPGTSTDSPRWRKSPNANVTYVDDIFTEVNNPIQISEVFSAISEYLASVHLLTE